MNKEGVIHREREREREEYLTHTHTHTHTEEYYTATQKDEIIQFVATWMGLETIILSEASQTETHLCGRPPSCVSRPWCSRRGLTTRSWLGLKERGVKIKPRTERQGLEGRVKRQPGPGEDGTRGEVLLIT